MEKYKIKLKFYTILEPFLRGGERAKNRRGIIFALLAKILFALH